MTEEKTKPVISKKDGEIGIAGWENTSKEGKKWISYSLSVRYKDADDEWHDGKNWSRVQLLRLKSIINQAITEEVARSE